MGGGASTAILHGCHPQNTGGDALHGGGTCTAATARVDARLDREGNCVRKNGTVAAANVFSVRRKQDSIDAVRCQRLGRQRERQRASLPHGGSTVGNYGKHGVDPPSAGHSDVDEPSSTCNRTVESATTSGKDGNARCGSIENDDNGLMTKEEAERWLNSQPVSPASCSMTEFKYPATTTADLSHRVYCGGDSKPSSSMRLSTPIRSRRSSDTAVETKLVYDDNGGEGSRSHDTSANAPRGDSKPFSNLSIITSEQSTSGATALSLAPNAHCCPANGARSASRKPRRDSFSASLRAAMNTSSATTPKQLFQTHREGGDGRSPSAATAAAVKGPELTLPRDQQRHNVFPKRSTITLATLRGTDGQRSGRTPQGGSRPEDLNPITRAIADDNVPRHRLPPSCLVVDQTSPCSSGMDDEEWLKVSLQPKLKGVTRSSLRETTHRMLRC